jgi:hypothetical protein
MPASRPFPCGGSGVSVPKKTSPRLAAARSAHHGERSGRTRAPHSGKITKKFGHSRRQPPPGSRKEATGVPEELQSNARIGVDLAVDHLESNESDMLAWVREYFVREQITGPDPHTDLKVALRDNQDFACVAFKEYQRLKTAQERKRWEEEGQWMTSVPLVTFAADLFFLLLVAEFIEHKEPLPESFRQWLIESLRNSPQARSTPLFNPNRSTTLVGRRNQQRDYQIGRAVLGVVTRYRVQPTRNRSKRHTANAAESACSIVAKALGTLGFNLSENAVEVIWNRLRGGQAAAAVLKSDWYF